MVFELSSSMFNNDGDTVELFAPDGILVDHYTYTKDPGIDTSIGRAPDGTGNFQVLTSVTEGSPNSLSQPTSTPTPRDKPTKESKPADKQKPAKSVNTAATPTSINNSVANKNILADSTTNTFFTDISPAMIKSATDSGASDINYSN